MRKINTFECNYIVDEVFYLKDSINNFFIPKENNNEKHIVQIQNKITLTKTLLVIDGGEDETLYGFKKINAFCSMPNPNYFSIIFGNIGYIINGINNEYKLISKFSIKDFYQDLSNMLFIVFFVDKIVSYNVNNKINWVVDLVKIVKEDYSIVLKKDNNIVLNYYNDQWEEYQDIKIDTMLGCIK
ncbi:hypothetical protein [Pontimicrobium sp. MEBiC06410]